MKKILSLILTIVLMFGCVSAADVETAPWFDAENAETSIFAVSEKQDGLMIEGYITFATAFSAEYDCIGVLVNSDTNVPLDITLWAENVDDLEMTKESIITVDARGECYTEIEMGDMHAGTYDIIAYVAGAQRYLGAFDYDAGYSESEGWHDFEITWDETEGIMSVMVYSGYDKNTVIDFIIEKAETGEELFEAGSISVAANSSSELAADLSAHLHDFGRGNYTLCCYYDGTEIYRWDFGYQYGEDSDREILEEINNALARSIIILREVLLKYQDRFEICQYITATTLNQAASILKASTKYEESLYSFEEKLKKAVYIVELKKGNDFAPADEIYGTIVSHEHEVSEVFYMLDDEEKRSVLFQMSISNPLDINEAQEKLYELSFLSYIRANDRNYDDFSWVIECCAPYFGIDVYEYMQLTYEQKMSVCELAAAQEFENPYIFGEWLYTAVKEVETSNSYRFEVIYDENGRFDISVSSHNDMDAEVYFMIVDAYTEECIFESDAVIVPAHSAMEIMFEAGGHLETGEYIFYGFADGRRMYSWEFYYHADYDGNAMLDEINTALNDSAETLAGVLHNYWYEFEANLDVPPHIIDNAAEILIGSTEHEDSLEGFRKKLIKAIYIASLADGNKLGDADNVYWTIVSGSYDACEIFNLLYDDAKYMVLDGMVGCEFKNIEEAEQRLYELCFLTFVATHSYDEFDWFISSFAHCFGIDINAYNELSDSNKIKVSKQIVNMNLYFETIEEFANFFHDAVQSLDTEDSGNSGGGASGGSGGGGGGNVLISELTQNDLLLNGVRYSNEVSAETGEEMYVITPISGNGAININTYSNYIRGYRNTNVPMSAIHMSFDLYVDDQTPSFMFRFIGDSKVNGNISYENIIRYVADTKKLIIPFMSQFEQKEVYLNDGYNYIDVMLNLATNRLWVTVNSEKFKGVAYEDVGAIQRVILQFTNGNTGDMKVSNPVFELYGSAVQDIMHADLEHKKYGIAMAITDCLKDRTSITVPEMIDNIYVTEIATDAFLNQSNLTEIYLPSTIERIEYAAFDGCYSLGTIYFDGTVEEWDAIEKLCILPDGVRIVCNGTEEEPIEPEEPVVPDEPEIPSDTDTKVYLTDAQTREGNIVAVDLMLENNTGFANIGVEIGYDSGAMTLVGIDENYEVGATFTTAMNYTSNPYNISIDSISNVYFNGRLATLFFEVNEEAAAGDYEITVDYYKGRDGYYIDGEDLNYDENGEDIDLYYANGFITVARHNSGDIDDNDKLNSHDATMLLRYLAGWDIEGVNEYALDVNGDSMVDNNDGIHLLRYLAGWDVKIY